MITRFFKVFAVGATCLLSVLAWTGCGNDVTKAVDDAKNLQEAASNMEQNMQQMSQKIDQFKQMEFTVETVEAGKTTSRWTQKNGNWRYDDPSDPGTYTMYNKDKNKTWSVNGKTAVEYSGANEMALIYSPVTTLSAFALAPKTGGSDDTWELGFGGDSISIEFKGPEGLPTKFTSVSSGDTKVTDYTYSNVGSVSDSTFDLPSDVKVTSFDNPTSGSSNSVSVPGGSSSY